MKTDGEQKAPRGAFTKAQVFVVRNQLAALRAIYRRPEDVAAFGPDGLAAYIRTFPSNWQAAVKPPPLTQGPSAPVANLVLPPRCRRWCPCRRR